MNTERKDFNSWLRVTVYDHHQINDEIFRIGTFYGKRPEILGAQINKILRSRWNLAKIHTEIDREQLAMTIILSTSRYLVLNFSTPGNHSRRAQAQWFGTMVRTITANIS